MVESSGPGGIDSKLKFGVPKILALWKIAEAMEDKEHGRSVLAETGRRTFKIQKDDAFDANCGDYH